MKYFEKYLNLNLGMKYMVPMTKDTIFDSRGGFEGQEFLKKT